MKSLRVLLGVWVLFVVGVVTCQAADDFLVFHTGDDESIEDQVGKYIQRTEGWNVKYQRAKNNPDDLFWTINFGLDTAPDVKLFFDTLDYQTDKNDNPISRKIKISAFRSNLEDEGMLKDARQKGLEEINMWMDKKSYMPRMYIDGDGDLRLELFIIVHDEAPVHIEQIRYTLKNVLDCWIAFNEELKEKGIINYET